MGKYTDDDYCDIYENKICDNCGKCLEDEGIDIRAIRIEDIAKTVEENKVLEEEYKRELEMKAEEEKEEENNSLHDDYNELNDAYESFAKEIGFDLDNLDEDYIDAFDHIAYLDDVDVNDDSFIEEMTEEIFPGVRKLKGTK